MRRITLWLFSTVAALVLLFSYRTSTNGSGTALAGTLAAAETGGRGTASAGSTGSAGSASASGSTGSTSGSGSARSGSAGSAAGSGSGTRAAGSTPSPARTKAAPTSQAYTGAAVDTRWGPVQVTITVADRRITDVAVPVYPTGNGRDEEINAYALPVLRQETLTAQSAAIDTVSGATVTSEGYLQSLQSALDAAHLA